MKTKLLSIVAFLIAGLLFQANVTKAQTVKEIKFERSKFDKPPIFNPITAILKINTQQPVSSQGLKFSVILRNNSGRSVMIYSPLDVLSIRLLDKDGGNQIIPHDPKFSAKYSGPFITKFESFDVVRVFLNGKAETTDFSKTENITISANGTYEMELAIKTVLKNSPVPTSTIKGDIATIEWPRIDQNAPRAELKNGNYKLNMSIGLYERPNVKGSFGYTLRTLETIQLGYGL